MTSRAPRVRGLFENVEMKMTKLVNEQCRDQAEIQIGLGCFINAMRWYNTASARTLGHKKSDAYEALARECAKKAGASYDPGSYAEDYEAVQFERGKPRPGETWHDVNLAEVGI